MSIKKVLIGFFLVAAIACSHKYPKHPDLWVTNITVYQLPDGKEFYEHPDTGETFWFVENTMPPRENYYKGGSREGYMWEKISRQRPALSYPLKVVTVVLNGETGVAYIGADGNFTPPAVLVAEPK